MGKSHHLIVLVIKIVLCMAMKKRINVSILFTTIRLALINYV